MQELLGCFVGKAFEGEYRSPLREEKAFQTKRKVVSGPEPHDSTGMALTRNTLPDGNCTRSVLEVLNRSPGDHAGRNGGVRHRIDQDKTAGNTVLRVRIKDQ